MEASTDVTIMDGNEGTDDSTEGKVETEDFSDKKRRNDIPPDDDCCPICFGSFTVPCRASCGHWYCGSCILQFWNYSAASKPCKCPMCSRYFNKLTPEASLLLQQDQEVKEVLASIQRYNRLFVGGVVGFVQMILSVFYAATPFDFIPTGGLGIVRVFDYAAFALVLTLRIVGLYRRRRLTQQVRHLAAAQQFLE